MSNKKDLSIMAFIIIIISLSLIPGIRSQINLANAQSPICDPLWKPKSSSHTLPVILIHGYREYSSIWQNWKGLLSNNNIPFCVVSFQPSSNTSYDEHNYDACGSAKDHAKDIVQIVQYVKNVTGQDKVNIVGHSKGGLDARVYLANTNTPNVANLIMIGTPNAGDLLANFDSFDTCIPAASDLTTFADDISANQNLHTKYYTISGVCSFWPIPNDGIVAKSSVESLSYSHSLGSTPHCHMGLLSETEYAYAKPKLLSR